MKRLACKDLSPGTDCTFEVAGETATEASEKMLVHAREHHAEDIQELKDKEVVEMFALKVHD